MEVRTPNLHTLHVRGMGRDGCGRGFGGRLKKKPLSEEKKKKMKERRKEKKEENGE